MNQETIEIEKILLQKFADFTNIVIKEIRSLKGQVSNHIQKEASFNQLNDAYRQNVKKVAQALYNADLDFVTGNGFDQSKFIKTASNDPSYLARMFEKVCNAADVSVIGRPARVAPVNNKKAAFNDPVYVRAFGNNILDEGVIDWEE